MKKLLLFLTMLCFLCFTVTASATYRIHLPNDRWIDIGGDCDWDDICWCEGENQICWETVAFAALTFGLLRVDVNCEEDGSPAVGVPIEIHRRLLDVFCDVPVRKAVTNDRGVKWFGLLPGLYDIYVNGEKVDSLVSLGIFTTKLKTYTIDCVPETTSTIRPTTTSIRPTTTSIRPTTSIVTTVPTTVPATTSVPFTTSSSVPFTTTIMGTSTSSTIASTTTTICKEDNRRCELQCKDECNLKPFEWVMIKVFPQTFQGIGTQGHFRNECYRSCMKDCTPLNRDGECVDFN